MSDHTLQLADSIAKQYYERDFYAHLSMLASVEFAFNPDLSKVGMKSSFSGFKFDQRKYISLQQAAFEEAPQIRSNETSDVDWEKIDFYAHLSMLASVEFAFNPDLSKVGMKSSFSGFKFDQRKYISLQQAAFEEAPQIRSNETSDVDWEKIDKKVYAFQDRKAINGEQNDTRLKKFTDFSLKCYEQWITYESMYPKSTSNPWQPAVKILECGRLLYVSDSLNELKNFTNSISRSVNKKNQGNIGIVVKGQAPTIRGFVIDDRYDIQKIVYAFLRREAPDHTSPVSLSNIKAYLKTLGHSWSIDAIQIRITTPLKKTGFVGSTVKGFFVIQTIDDLISSYRFHRTKVVSINTILKQYQVRSREFGEIDLQEEFGGPTINRID